MRERAYTFGSHDGLVGILCEPDARVASGAPAVLLFNVGLNHHVGPHRFNVDLARHLAGRGVVSFRFDLSGLGDSQPRRDNLADEERSILDVQEAMTFLQERREINSFILVSMCSGVDPAHAISVADERVKGSVFVDGYAYTTPGYERRYRLKRLARFFSRAAYARWLTNRLLPRLGRQPARETGEDAAIFDRTYPPLEQFKADLETMRARGVKLLFIYTRHAYFYDYPDQFAPMIGADRVPPGIEVVWQPGADHVFTAVAERARAIRRISDWLGTHFGIQAIPVASAEAAGRRAGRESRGVAERAALPEVCGP